MEMPWSQNARENLFSYNSTSGTDPLTIFRCGQRLGHRQCAASWGYSWSHSWSMPMPHETRQAYGAVKLTDRHIAVTRPGESTGSSGTSNLSQTNIQMRLFLPRMNPPLS